MNEEKTKLIIWRFWALIESPFSLIIITKITSFSGNFNGFDGCI